MTIAKAEAILRGRDDTAQMFRSFVRNAETANRQVTQKFRSAFQLITGGIIGQQLRQAITQSIEKAGNIEALAQSFSSTTEEISRLDYAARQSNSSIEEVAGSFQRLFTSISKAEQGSKRQVRALEELGLSSERFLNLSLTDQIGLIADSWNRLENPQQKARLAQDLFGASTSKIVPLLKRGSDGILELTRESDHLGNTLTRETAQRLAEAEASLRKVEAASGALKRELAIGLGPALVAVNEFFTTIAKGAQNFWEAMLGPSDPVGQLQERLAELANRRNLLLRSIEQAEAHGASPRLTEAWRAEVAQLEIELNKVNGALQQFGRDAAAYEDAAGGTAAATRELLEVMVMAERITPGYSESLQKMFRETATEAQKAADAYFEFLSKLQILLDADVIDRDEFNKRLKDFQDRTLKEVEVTAKKIFPEAKKGAEDLMKTLKDESARRAFSALSDAIAGAGGSARDFANDVLQAFRRILADRVTLQLFELFAGMGKGSSGGGFWGAIASGIGALFGGGRGAPGSTPTVPKLGKGYASGGFMAPGEFGIVGEHGPEFALAGRTGATIIPFPKERAGSAVQVININISSPVDARGADIGLTQRLPAIMAENNRQQAALIESTIVTKLKRRQYDLG